MTLRPAGEQECAACSLVDDCNWVAYPRFGGVRPGSGSRRAWRGTMRYALCSFCWPADSNMLESQ